MKRLLIILSLALVAGVFTVYLYDRVFNPELSFFRQALSNTDQWEKEMRKLGKPCTIICGASETRMGIEPAIMLEEFGMPAVNAGGAAGFGTRCNAALALRYLQSGDTMLFSFLSLSPRALPATTDGLKLATLHLGSEVYSSGIIPLTAENLKMSALGDTRSLCTWLAKLVFSPDLIYKYAKNTIIHPSGWVEVLYRDMANAKAPLLNPPALYRMEEKGEVINFLHELDEHCQNKQARLLIHIPVGFAHPTYQAQHAYTALQLTRAGFSVLRDERLGVVSDPHAFSDIGVHLSGEGTRENTRIIARALKYDEYWTERELVLLLRFMGWSDRGTRLAW